MDGVTRHDVRAIWQELRGYRLPWHRVVEFDARTETQLLTEFTETVLRLSAASALKRDNGELLLQSWLHEAAIIERERTEFEAERAERHERNAQLKPYGQCESCGFVVDDFGHCMCSM